MFIIYSKFNSLDIEKRERILNAAFKEFARNGYEKASTNKIIKEANISKGSLFNYFKNKKELYFFLIRYSNKIINNSYKKIDLNNRDIFDRIREIGLINFNIMKKFPEVFDFLKRVFNEESIEIKSDINEIYGNIIDNGFEKIYENIDFTKFREDIDVEKAIKILNWSMIGFAEEEKEKIASFENIDDKQIKKWDLYSNILKKCFYKE